MKEALINLPKLIDCALLAWYMATLKPLQRAFEWGAEESGAFYTFFYAPLSCMYCLGFWITLAVVSSGVELPSILTMPIMVSFVIKSVRQTYERILFKH